MKLLINYANDLFRESQQQNSATGLAVASFDRVICYGPDDIDPDFRRQNRAILNCSRGNGYWLWKPYFIEKSLSELRNGDLLFYSDSGCHFVAALDPLFEVCDRSGHDLICFAGELVEKHWTKRDAFLLLNCDQPNFTDTPQRYGTYSLWKKSDFTVNFVQEWLAAATDPRLITDLANQLTQPNYEGFREHRHDQSLFSLLTKKHGLPAYRDPSQFGNPYMASRPDSPYGQLIELTRKRGRLPLLSRILRESRRLVEQVIAGPRANRAETAA